MSKKPFTVDSKIYELLEVQAIAELFNIIAPGMADSPTFTYVKNASLSELSKMASEDQQKKFLLLLDAANGKEINPADLVEKPQPPKVLLQGGLTYNLDDIDGQMYMLERRFSGCLILRFSKKMDEKIYGKVCCNGKELPQGLLKSLEMAGGIQMLGVPVRKALTEYNMEYNLTVEGFTAIDGMMMETQSLTVRTLPKAQPDTVYEEHDKIALQAAREGIVLLKNENDILPLASESKIAISCAEEFRLGTVGAGRINPRYSIGFLRAVNEFSSFRQDESAEIGILVICRGCGENLDGSPIKGEFYLTDEEETKIALMTNKYSKTIAIVNSGYPMDIRWVEKYNVNALLWCGYAGMLGGKALVEILDGRVNPSAKLPDTWSLDYYDIPSSMNFYNSADGRSEISTDSKLFVDTVYEEDIYVGYRYFETFDKPVAYPFGFGLSYTQFQILGKTENLNVYVTVTNTGATDGAEVVQVYAVIPDGKLEQPSKRLVAFGKSKILSPMESQILTFNIQKQDISSYDTEDACWKLEKGRYELFVGNSIKQLIPCGAFVLEADEILKQVKNRMRPQTAIDVLSKRDFSYPKGLKSGIKENVDSIEPKAVRQHFTESSTVSDLVSKMSVEELARLSVCASAGWGMHQKGEAGRIYKLENYNIPDFIVADGNNGVNVNNPNIGMPCSGTVCATFNQDLAYQIGRVIAEEAKENSINMILAPGMNIHRNPLNGRHPEYFSEDPYLTGVMAGNQSKGLEENGVSSCLKHVVANNCESSRKRNQSIISERALREIYVKAFEVAIGVHNPDSIMTGYNAVNGIYTAEDEEMIQGIFREEFGFRGFVMTDWNSYDTVDIAAANQAGNCWMTPGSIDNTYVTPIIEGVQSGRIDIERLRNNVRYILKTVFKRTNRVCK